MIDWVIPLLLSFVLIPIIYKMIGDLGIRSKRLLGVALLLALLLTHLMSYRNNVYLPMDVFGMHLAAICMAALAIILGLKEGIRKGAAGIILGLAVSVPIASIYMNIGSYYWMNWISIIIAAVVLMFGSDHMRERPHLDADVPRTLCLVGLIVVSMAFLWFGLMGLGLSFFVNQYIIVLFSTAAFVAVEVILTAGLRKTSSNRDAMLLAMELATLNLVLSFFSAAIIWN